MAITDNFNRSDGWIGTGWRLVYGNRWKVVSNAATPTVTFQESLLVRAEKTFPSDHYAQAKCEFTSNVDISRSNVCVRTQANGNCYYAILSATGVGLNRRTSPSTAVFVGDSSANPFTLSADTLYTVKIEAIGTTIKVYVDRNDGNGLVERISVTDATLSGGKPGITEGSGGGTLARVEDFECTDATDGAIPPIAYFNYAASTAGVGAITPAIPADVEANDILLLFVETANQTVTLSTANGFASVDTNGTGTAGGTSATRIAVFWKRATGSDSAPTVADSGDHQVAQIAAWRGCITSGDPWDVKATDVETTQTQNFSTPSVTTTVNNCQIVSAVANTNDTNNTQFPWNPSNSNLTDVHTVLNVNNTSGNGGGFGVTNGWLPTAGSSGNTTGSHTGGTAPVVQARITIALKPPAVAGGNPRLGDMFMAMAA